MLLDEALALETQVWNALQTGDAGADGSLLSEDFVGVYTTGFATKAEHVGQLDGGPTIAEYQIVEPRVIDVSDHASLLSYRADFRRPASDTFESMYVTSLWSRRDDRWINTFSQDTPTAG